MDYFDIKSYYDYNSFLGDYNRLFCKFKGTDHIMTI